MSKSEVTARSGGNFEISESCFLGGSTGNLASSDGSGSTVAEASTNSADLEAYTLSGSQCTTDEGGLLSSTECLPLATSEVCVLQTIVDTEFPSLAPSIVPTGLGASNFPTIVEVEISINPIQPLSNFPSDLPSSSPSITLEPSFLPTKPPTYRQDCPEGDDDDGDGKGKGTKRDQNCRKKKYKRMKREKIFGSNKGSKLSKLSKSSKTDKSKSEKSKKTSSHKRHHASGSGSGSSSSSRKRNGGKGRWWI
jgi:hypothetical protein